ncbi:MAG: hypothetical protein LBT47_08495, partial [Deltaproteobacteria bacterium]|nr:hypothetical protein [Deltaproteobacteria bacterium]
MEISTTHRPIIVQNGRFEILTPLTPTRPGVGQEKRPWDDHQGRVMDEYLPLSSPYGATVSG